MPPRLVSWFRVCRVAGLYDQSSSTDDDDHEHEDHSGVGSSKTKDKTRIAKRLKAKAREKAAKAREAEKQAMQQELMDIEVLCLYCANRPAVHKMRYIFMCDTKSFSTIRYDTIRLEPKVR